MVVENLGKFLSPKTQMAPEELVDWYCKPVENGKWVTLIPNALGAYTPCATETLVVALSHLVLLCLICYRIWLIRNDYSVKRFCLQSRLFNYGLGTLAAYNTAEPLYRAVMGFSVVNLDGQGSLAPFKTDVKLEDAKKNMEQRIGKIQDDASHCLQKVKGERESLVEDVKHSSPTRLVLSFTAATTIPYPFGGHAVTVEIMHSMWKSQKFKSIYLLTTLQSPCIDIDSVICHICLLGIWGTVWKILHFPSKMDNYLHLEYIHCRLGINSWLWLRWLGKHYELYPTSENIWLVYKVLSVPAKGGNFSYCCTPSYSLSSSEGNLVAH